MKKTLSGWLPVVGTALFLSLSCHKDDAQAPMNKRPYVTLQKEYIIVLPRNEVELEGTGRDIDGRIVGYQWTKLSGPSLYRFVDSTVAVAKVTDLVEGIYKFGFKVTDDKGVSAKTSTMVAVLAHCPCEPNCDPYGDPCNPWDY